MEKMFPASLNQKKIEVAILISDKIDFKNCSKRQRSSLYNDEEVNSLKEYSNYKYVRSQRWSTLQYKKNNLQI